MPFHSGPDISSRSSLALPAFQSKRIDRGGVLVRASCLLLAAIAGPGALAQSVISTVATGPNPFAIAVNTVTNKVYVVSNSSSGNVTEIDGATRTTTPIPVGANPDAIDLDMVANKIYVANNASNSVTEIDGATHATVSVAVGGNPTGIAVNPVTHQIYVVNATFEGSSSYGSITVIDGITHATTQIAVGSNPGAIAVNSVADKAYFLNLDGGAVATEIDGAANTISSLGPVSFKPDLIAVDAVTDTIYVGQVAAGGITVINGAANSSASVGLGYLFTSLAVDSATHKIYATSDGTNAGVTVIDGATHAVSMVLSSLNPVALAVNPVTHVVYAANNQPAGSVTAINGATNAVTTLPAGTSPFAIAVNPVTNVVYVLSNDAEGTVTVIDGAASAPPPPPPPSGPSSTRLVNISTRALVGTGGNILIPGFVVSGEGTETLLIRADGPGLAQFGVIGVLARPSLSVFDNTGTVIASNTGWGSNSNPAQIASTAASVGAFPLAVGSADCALMANLSAGAYTVQVSGVSGGSGVALAEIYEVASGGTRLANISTRAPVGTGANIIIPGFVVSGSGTEQLLVRADGPGLAQFGVSGLLADPSLSVLDGSGTVIASNSGWSTSSNAPQIASTAAAVGAFALTPGSADSAQIVNLTPGAYTMQVVGVNDSTGVALAEVYEVK